MESSELLPIIIGGLVSIITGAAGGFWAYYSQRSKVQADSLKVIEETNEIVYQRGRKEVEALGKSIDDMRHDLAEAEKQRRETVIAWEKERYELVQKWEKERLELSDSLAKAKSDLLKMSHELAESYAEIETLRQTIETVRQEAKRQVDRLQSEIKALQEENTMLKAGRGKRF
jgi:uncharacterized protein (DUF3084 family)